MYLPRTQVVNHFKPALDKLYKGLVDNLIVKTLAKKLAQHRGPENPELMAEINGIASTVGWPVYIVQSAQVLYELQVPIRPCRSACIPPLPSLVGGVLSAVSPHAECVVPADAHGTDNQHYVAVSKRR